MRFDENAEARRAPGSPAGKFGALIFDFDGVLLESEAEGNRQIAEYLTAIGHPTTPEQSMTHFMGLAGADFLARLEAYIGGPLPADFHAAREAENRRALEAGIDPVAGAVAFVSGLPPALPKAIASSSSTKWIRTHLRHLGLDGVFGEHIYSGREHVARGKPAPDLYLHAAARLGIPIEACAIIEDSPVGATGAVASGAYVIGLTAGSHCAPGHGELLRAIGVDAVAADFAEVERLIA